jgi:hypothetical protein
VKGTCFYAVLFLMVVSNQLMSETPPPARTGINAVLAAHEKELLAIPGVVGIYVGVLDDGKSPCLKIMLARRTPESSQIPAQIDGFPVRVKVTGEIQPLGQ